MSASAKSILRATLAVACLALLLAAAAGAAPPAKTPTGPPAKKTTTAPLGPTGKTCWNALIRDWYDGRIDKTYEVHCYRDALKHLPQDVRTYSDAYDVISRALANATRGKQHVDPNAQIPPPDADSTGTTGKGSTTTAGPGNGNASGGGPIGGVLNGGDQGANGVPIPLLVLAGLAVLLVAAGGAGLVYRRYQGRGGTA